MTEVYPRGPDAPDSLAAARGLTLGVCVGTAAGFFVTAVWFAALGWEEAAAGFFVIACAAALLAMVAGGTR